jgi:hypothetical protein
LGKGDIPYIEGLRGWPRRHVILHEDMGLKLGLKLGLKRGLRSNQHIMTSIKFLLQVSNLSSKAQFLFSKSEFLLCKE